LAEEKEGKVVVAKCDATSERAVSARFGVTGYPAIYHLSKNGGLIGGREVRKYDGRRSLEEMSEFLDGGWRTQSKMSLWSSPYGPLGRAKGLFIWCGAAVVKIHGALVEQWGFSQAAAGLVVGCAAISIMVLAVLILAVAGGEEAAHPHAD